MNSLCLPILTNKVGQHVNRIVSIISLLLLALQVCAQEVVRIRSAQSVVHPAYTYYRDLLRVVLDLTAGKYGPVVIVENDVNTNQARNLLLVKNGQGLDLEWAGTNIERETILHPIRVPLNLGLLGERLLVIKKTRHSEFEKITEINQLRMLTACQGQHWPDSDILEYNHFKVERAIENPLMWDMLDRDRCDYFPRAIIEGYLEVDKHGNDRFEVYDHILISYSYPMFFFVAVENHKLASRLEEGLRQMWADGSLKRFMEYHEVTRAAFPLSHYKSSIRFVIDNPYLSDETRYVMKQFAILH